MVKTRVQAALAGLLVFGMMAAVPRAAEAQRRAGPRAPVSSRSYGFRSYGFFGGGFGYPGFVYYDPFFFDYQWGYPYYQYGPWGYPYGYPPYGYAWRGDLTSEVRLEVKPRQAQVFVDGYAAGVVDDYDGVFQRLRLRPGSHEIVIYLPGYRTVHQSVYLNPGADQRIKFNMEVLPPGQPSEPPPTPPAPPASAQQQYGGPGALPPGIRAGRPVPMGRMGPPNAPPTPPPPPAPPAPDGTQNPDQAAPQGETESSVQPAQPQQSMTATFGTLSLRVQPAGAEILVDGQPWPTPAGQDRIEIQLAEGSHHIEVHKDGFTGYAQDVTIRHGNTLTLNVSLPPVSAGAH